MSLEEIDLVNVRRTSVTNNNVAQGFGHWCKSVGKKLFKNEVKYTKKNRNVSY